MGHPRSELRWRTGCEFFVKDVLRQKRQKRQKPFWPKPGQIWGTPGPS
jgi:hypothetical protein